MAGELTPTPKIAAASWAGAASILLVWILGMFGVEMPDVVAAAVAALLAAGAGYLKSQPTS